MIVLKVTGQENIFHSGFDFLGSLQKSPSLTILLRFCPCWNEDKVLNDAIMGRIINLEGGRNNTYVDFFIIWAVAKIRLMRAESELVFKNL